MSSPLIASNREKAEISTGDVAGKQKVKELLKKFSFPSNLLPVNDVVEVGYNHSTGFLWIIQKKKVEHTFRALNRKVNFDTEVTAFIEDRRMKKLTGAKSRELMIWFTICDIHINDPKSGKIVFGSTVGVTRTFPVTAFEEEKVEKEEKVENLTN